MWGAWSPLTSRPSGKCQDIISATGGECTPSVPRVYAGSNFRYTQASLLKKQGDTLAYERRSGDTRLFVALNLGGTPQIVSLPSWARGGKVLRSTLDGSAIGQDSNLVLRPTKGS
jgi:hypothetical protein